MELDDMSTETIRKYLDSRIEKEDKNVLDVFECSTCHNIIAASKGRHLEGHDLDEKMECCDCPDYIIRRFDIDKLSFSKD